LVFVALTEGASRYGEIVNKTRLGTIFGRGRREIEDWVAEGCPVVKAAGSRGEDWKFATAQVIEWLATGKGKVQERIDLNAERARLAKEQADGQSLKNSVARGELLPAENVENAWMAAIGRCRALLLGVPTSSAGRIVLLARQHEDAKEAERAVRELLINLIDTAVNELRNVTASEDDDEDGSGDATVAA
jgi:phage terminase Nu1 subunit (DNA packaging protein)